MTDDCYCDYDPATVYHVAEHAARKEHRCSECFRQIKVGEPYERVFAICDGDACTFKTCLRCLALRKFVMAHVPCLCWTHGNVIDDCIETAEYYAHETVGLMFGALRRRILIYRNK